MKEVEALVGSGKPAQERFREIQVKMREQARDCDAIFHRRGRITDEEVQMFGEGTRASIVDCLKVWSKEAEYF